MTTSNNHPQRRRGLTAAGVALGLTLAARTLLAQRRQEADLRGQVAVVTGGSRGLGLAISRELASHGCRLAICARNDLELARARADLEQSGAEVLAVPCDVTDRDQVAAMVELVTTRYGGIDILVNNAGIMVVAPVEAVTHDDLERVMATNFWGTVNPSLAVLPGMRARGAGRIVNITSIGGKVPVPHMLPYTCAKFGAVGFSSGLRAELLDAGITVTTVVPGLMRTGSYLHAEFGGDQEDEYRWFALGASAPYPVTVSAERAARTIVQAARRGQAECSFPFTATLAARVAGMLPTQTVNALGMVDHLLPDPLPLPTGTTEGLAIEPAVDGGLFSVMTTMGRTAAERHNQLATSRPIAG